MATILEQATGLSREWASEWQDRQQRTSADPEDFRRLREMGVPLMSIPGEFGGSWEGLARTARPIGTMLRTLAQGDPSVTLSSAMHHLVLDSWRRPSAPEPYTEAFDRQRREVFQTVQDGAWWGTLISEPGSGGDIGKTRSAAIPEAPGSLHYRMSGLKHFGSGSGQTSFMTTRAIPEGETSADLFYLEVGNVPWDGSTGMSLTAEWRGHGMMSTNSHAFSFRNFPATRIAFPDNHGDASALSGGLGGMSFTSVIAGVVDAAMEYTRQNLMGSASQGRGLRAYQQVEWSNAQQEAWLIEQAWEGAMRSIERELPNRSDILFAKECVAGLAESVLSRLCKLTGGTAYTRYSPLGAWFEDVRALGYLRPPWSLAYDQMYQLTWEE
jgi:alkylation response protein AidB-like acyl-CoA dehydrogenase